MARELRKAARDSGGLIIRGLSIRCSGRCLRPTAMPASRAAWARCRSGGMVTTLLTDRREVGEGRQENHHHEPGQLSAPEQRVARGDQDDVEQGPGRDEDGHGARKEYRRGLPMRVLSHPATLRAARISSRRSRGQGQQSYQVPWMCTEWRPVNHSPLLFTVQIQSMPYPIGCPSPGTTARTPKRIAAHDVDHEVTGRIFVVSETGRSRRARTSRRWRPEATAHRAVFPLNGSTP